MDSVVLGDWERAWGCGVMRLLLEHTADFNIKIGFGWTMLY
jgi:hypothetical protein